jgi:hypothetical protein
MKSGYPHRKTHAAFLQQHWFALKGGRRLLLGAQGEDDIREVGALWAPVVCTTQSIGIHEQHIPDALLKGGFPVHPIANTTPVAPPTAVSSIPCPHILIPKANGAPSSFAQRCQALVDGLRALHPSFGGFRVGRSLVLYNGDTFKALALVTHETRERAVRAAQRFARGYIA